ncbi:MAG TPA: hypothetical protein VJC03_07010 [bacterium]|nr:hypothetical protein [bacterium]
MTFQNDLEIEGKSIKPSAGFFYSKLWKDYAFTFAFQRFQSAAIKSGGSELLGGDYTGFSFQAEKVLEGDLEDRPQVILSVYYRYSVLKKSESFQEHLLRPSLGISKKIHSLYPFLAFRFPAVYSVWKEEGYTFSGSRSWPEAEAGLGFRKNAFYGTASLSAGEDSNSFTFSIGKEF